MLRSKLLQRVIANQAGLPLDEYPPTEFYSMRYNISSFEGSNVIDVQRSSDDVVQGFTPDEITNGSLESFCGASDGLIKTIYGHKGVANLTQSTKASMPKIVSGGSLITENGKPVFSFDGANHFINHSTALYSTDLTVFLVLASPMPQDAILFQTGRGGSNLLSIGIGDLGTDSVYSSRFRVSGSRNKGGEDADTTQTLLSQVCIESPESTQMYYNGSVATQSYEARSDSSLTGLVLGGQGGGGTYAETKIQEVIIYNSDQSSNRAGIEAIVNDYYGVF